MPPAEAPVVVEGSPAVASHHDEVVCVGGGVERGGVSPEAGGTSPAIVASGGTASGPFRASRALPLDRPRPARRARAWYSGPCFRGSAYSLGLIVQYVPDVVPYHEAPPQSGENASGSTSSYEVEPSVAFFRLRSLASDG